MAEQRRGMVGRRNLIRGAIGLAGASALLAMVPPSLKAAVRAAEGLSLEKTRLTLGFIPLTDCAVLVVAQEKGFFKRHGLSVTLSKEASWANIRDKVAIGALDGAHMLAGMPIASTLGIGAMRKPMVTAFSMDLNGNAITVSNELFDRMMQIDPAAMAERPASARALKQVIEADKGAGKPPMTFGMVFPVSSHNYELRYWLAAGGVDPDGDIRLVVIPPPQMVANLQSKNIVGYCVGEPWNERAVSLGIGRAIVTDYEIWNNSPEKVLGVNRDWAAKHPNTHRALLMALLEAALWMDQAEHRPEVVRMISQKAYVDAPEEVVRMSMTGTFQHGPEEAPRTMPDFNVFYRYAATFPWRSHAAWFVTQMLRWGQIQEPVDVRKTAQDVYLPELYREAAQALGLAYPTIDYKTEGTHPSPWTLTQATAPIVMGPDRFFDRQVYDPDQLLSYLAAFDIKHMKVTLDELAPLCA